MAKITHNNIVDTINDIVNQAKNRDIIHLQFNSSNWDGKILKIANNELINFGTCGYLGLETNQKLITKACEFTQKFGTQFSISRAYVTSKINIELEEKLTQIFDGRKTIVFSSTTLAHISVLPIIIENSDYIILDQQAHVSMQTASQLLGSKGIPIDIIRHNNLEMLERKIQENRDKYNKIWYIIDGVYSMFGDLAPFDKLNDLSKKYPSLHFYVDDAHGMSWNGKNGSGCAFEKFKDNNKTILVTTMAKGFGSIGGIVVFPNEKPYQRVLLHGGPLSYSHPITPSIIGASIASADIHLSNEIYELQNNLKEKIDYCNDLLEQTNLPVLSNPKTPIYFIGTGQPNVGYNVNKRMLDNGFYVNIGMFPAVSVKNTGLRFTLTNHLSKEDIKKFIKTLEYQYNTALTEEGKTINEIRKVFKLDLINENKSLEQNAECNFLKSYVYKSIHEIDKEIWDSLFGDKGNFDWEALRVMENGFSNNTLPEDNWEFRYLIIKDTKTNNIVLATFFTICLMKDDMLENVEISNTIEQIRENDKYFLTSKALTMGCLLTEGNHLFMDQNNSLLNDALLLLNDTINDIKNSTNVNNVFLRDFDYDDKLLNDFFNNVGYFKVNMPNSNAIEHLRYKTDFEFYSNLTTSSRKHIKKDVLKHYDYFEQIIAPKLSNDELKKFYELYQNVVCKNKSINIFKYPLKFFKEIIGCNNWEFFIIKIRETGEIAAIACCYKTATKYFPVVVGIDYSINKSYNVYKQILFRIVCHAGKLEYKGIYLGFSADLEKKKLGAKQIPKVAYVDFNDLFNMEIINNLTNHKNLISQK